MHEVARLTEVGEMRFGVVVLAALAAVMAPAIGTASPIWCSPFETDNGVAVTHEQAAAVIDNRVGAPGVAAGSVSTLTAPIYVPYDGSIFLPDGTPLLPPSALDPVGAALNFGLSMPDERSTGINTGIRSNVGNLASGLTFEGYFILPTADLANDKTFVARRLVTQSRGASGASRLAVGIHAARVGVVEGLFDYEGFDYTGTAIAGQNGGAGWNGTWVDGDNDFELLTNDGVSLASGAFPFTAIGAHIYRQSTTATTAAEATRNLSRSIDLSQEGNVLYLSFLGRKTPGQAATSGEALEINLVPTTTTTTQVARFGINSNDQFFLGSGGTTVGWGTATSDTYFFVAKIVSHAGNDELFMNVYPPTGTVPTTEPTTWDSTSSITGTNSGLNLTALYMGMGRYVIDGAIDEIRVGSSYEAVTSPDAPMGNPGQMRNVLAVLWVEETAPNTFVNHLELGTTPVDANRWYYFAMIHDGTNVSWQLDNTAQGNKPTPGIVGAGAAQIAIANNRVAGTNDRGFYGILDEIRLWDRALATNELLVNGGGPGAGLLWRSRFETDSGQPVSSTPPLDTADTFACIDNSAGSPDGTPAGIVASFYAAYGETGVPAIPSGPTDIDAGHLAGSYALSLPDIPFVAIDTKLPSDTGGLATAVTVQGYFNTLRTLPVTATQAGSRLVTLMRSASQGSLRLAIGLGPNADTSPTNNVLSLAWADTNNDLWEVKGTTPIVAGTWYHFALVYDGTDVRWYLNGVQEGELLAPSLAPAGSGEIIIGNDRSLGGTRGFYGLLDKIVVSDHVIAPAQFMPAALDPCLGKWCNQPFADFDGDHDVDMADFGAFQRCFGLGALLEGNPCLCLDKNSDTEVTGADFAEFVKCVTGPAVLWDQAVTPDCNP